MYGKIFDTIYDGTLAEDWRALITFQQMIVLCDADGTIDMTPAAISRRTGIPIEHIKAGIEILENPDPYSRTEGEDGRRIRRLDPHRPWGWYLVNHEKYKALQDAETVRAQNRERKRRQRMRDAGIDDTMKHGCAYCGAPATGPDHVVPKCKGGDESSDNIVPCCPRCNQHKAHRTLSEFILDPFVDWIDFKLIASNPKLNCHATVTQLSRPSRHTDKDIDTNTDKSIVSSKEETGTPVDKPVDNSVKDNPTFKACIAICREIEAKRKDGWTFAFMQKRAKEGYHHFDVIREFMGIVRKQYLDAPERVLWKLWNSRSMNQNLTERAGIREHEQYKNADVADSVKGLLEPIGRGSGQRAPPPRA